MSRMNGKKTHTHNELIKKKLFLKKLEKQNNSNSDDEMFLLLYCSLPPIGPQPYPVIIWMPIRYVVTKKITRSTGHIMVTTRYSDQQRSKSRQKVCDSTNNGTDQYQNGSSNLFTPYREQPQSTRIVVGCRLPTTSVLSNKEDKLRLKFLKVIHRTKTSKNEGKWTEVGIPIPFSDIVGGGKMQTSSPPVITPNRSQSNPDDMITLPRPIQSVGMDLHDVSGTSTGQTLPRERRPPPGTHSPYIGIVL